MHSITSATPEICRMSWFLIELDEGTRDGNAANGKIVYCIIHSVDLIDSDPSNMYTERLVQFRLNNSVLEGKVLLASDDRNVVEQRMKVLTQDDEATEVATETNRRFLVQYNKGCNNVIHAILSEKDICQPVEDLTKQHKVMIKDGKLQRLARLLYASDYEESVHEELMRLKNHCFEATFDDADEDIKMPNDSWLLIQYSCSSNDVIYAIINHTETIWHAENLYPDVVAYISDGVNIFQAIILRKSMDRSELDSELERIKELSSSNHVAKNVNGQNSQCNNSNGSIDESEEEEFCNPIDFKNVLEKMEQQMHREAAMIANAFESIDRVKRTMERRLYVLNINNP